MKVHACCWYGIFTIYSTKLHQMGYEHLNSMVNQSKSIEFKSASVCIMGICLLACLLACSCADKHQSHACKSIISSHHHWMKTASISKIGTWSKVGGKKKGNDMTDIRTKKQSIKKPPPTINNHQNALHYVAGFGGVHRQGEQHRGNEVR